MFGKEFEVLKELNDIFKKVGDNYSEYFFAYEEDGLLNYCIIDDNFGMPSPANYDNGDYAKKLRKRSSDILQGLVDKGYITLKNSY